MMALHDKKTGLNRNAVQAHEMDDWCDAYSPASAAAMAGAFE